MAFLCPVRIKKKNKGVPPRSMNVDVPLPGRITGSDSIDTLVRVGIEKEHGPRARMVVVHDFLPCVDDELAVKRGQQVQVLYQENDWLYVITSKGKEGFIPYTYCLPVERSVDDFVLPRSKQEYLTQNGCKIPESHAKASKTAEHQQSSHQRHQNQQYNRHNYVNQPALPQHHQPQQSSQHQMNGRSQKGTNHSYSANTKHRPQSAHESNQTVPQAQNSNLARTSSKSLPDVSAVPVSSKSRREVQNQEQQRQRSKSQERYQENYRKTHNPQSVLTNKSFTYSHNNPGLTYGENTSYTSKSAPTTPDWRRKPETQPDLIHDYYNIVPLLAKSQQKSETDTYYADMDQMRSKRNVASTSNFQTSMNSSSNENWQRSHQYRASVKSQPDTWTSVSNERNMNTTNNSSTLPRNFSSHNHKNQTFQRAQSLHIPNSKSSQPNQSRISHQRQNSLPASNNNQNVHSHPKWDQQPDVVCQVFQKHSYGQYIVLYSYSPRQENDLSVERGEFVTVLNREDSEWFWVKNTRNQEGFVPRTFIIPAEGQEERKNILNNTKAHQSSNIQMAKSSKHQERPVKTSPGSNFALERATRLVCLYDYKALAPDDLSVSRGQWLYADLEGQSDPEWIHVFSPLSRKAGYIPRTYAKPPNFGSISGNTKDPYMSP